MNDPTDSTSDIQAWKFISVNMSEAPVVSTTTPTELLATGRRHLAVRDYTAATEVLAGACEALAAEHGDTADQCAEAYLWYVIDYSE
ncbi:unnamed protein product [Plutella xylostella]|uniref:(diamondback moth) hypothetical protein n=1 Tax=Plutella xylostella TaxID=51655 RepID=A0A8S4G0H8_PLUXY|nr:unnamed protein product [Plutella xylostella]